jgi:hypothetical protein
MGQKGRLSIQANQFESQPFAIMTDFPRRKARQLVTVEGVAYHADQGAFPDSGWAGDQQIVRYGHGVFSGNDGQ